MISAGILPSGFCRRSESPASVGSAFSIVTSFSRPRMPSASFTLRPNGEGGEERRIIIGDTGCGESAQCAPARRIVRADNRGGRRASRKVSGASAGDHQVDGLRAFALLVGLDVEVDALAFVER